VLGAICAGYVVFLIAPRQEAPLTSHREK